MKHKIPPEKIDSSAGSSALPVIEFYKNIFKLKSLYRQGWLHKGVSTEVCESVAEHTFAMALTALQIFKVYNPPLQLSKVLVMILIHDAGEIFAGDFTPKDFVSEEEKYSAELRGLQKLFGNVKTGIDYIAVWKEFEENSTAEAKFVRQLDKLEMALQANIYERTENIDLKEFFNSADEAIYDEIFRDIFSKLLKERS